MDNLLTLGSLFDGSGGFPLGAVFSGILPLWASEVAPFAIRVTTKRLPWMRHLGDIHNINGAEIEPVDIITLARPARTCRSQGSARDWKASNPSFSTKPSGSSGK